MNASLASWLALSLAFAPAAALAQKSSPGATRAKVAGPPRASAAAAGRATPAAAARVFDPADFDTTCAPCRDFDQYANGGWLRRTPLPPAYAEYGAFDELYDRNQVVVRDILEGAASQRGALPRGDRRRLGDYYASCMDSAAAEAAGITPIAPLLLALDSIATSRDVAAQVAWQHLHGIRPLFEFRAAQDPKNSDVVIAIASQGGLGLPDRDYYFRDDSAAIAVRDRYRSTMSQLLRMSGEDAAVADRHAAAVLELERAMAQASMTRVQRRDPRAIYHKMAFDSLVALAPAFAWDVYRDTRRTRPDSVNVQQPAFFRAVDSLLRVVPIDTWKAYLRQRVLYEAAPTLSSPFVREWFALRRALTGARELQPRWKRCLADTDEDLGEIVGREYVARRFSPEDKSRMLRMVGHLKSAQADRIRSAEWMSDTTRGQALGKLETFVEKIGYPDTWRDYASVTVSRRAHFVNRLEAKRFESARNLAKIGKPVERGEWIMTPPTVNAYYAASLNSINFPAGILQPPFYDTRADDATNYGAIGAVIGHEISHGFDDRGRQFDARGNLRDWWTERDAANYKARADRVVEQFDAYPVLDSMRVNGRLTLGENIADLAGLAIAYAAMERAYAGRPRDVRQGFTPEQRFFLGWARIWRTLLTDASLRTQVLTDEHAPPKWRINGPLSNLDEFRRAWGCRDTDPMVRPAEQRARIW